MDPTKPIPFSCPRCGQKTWRRIVARGMWQQENSDGTVHKCERKKHKVPKQITYKHDAFDPNRMVRDCDEFLKRR